MNLIIDIGNSVAKVAVTGSGGDILANYEYAELSRAIIEEVLLSHKGIESAIISSTRRRDPVVESYLGELVERTILFDHTTPVPLINMYGTPETLGMDRLAAAIGAWSQMPDEELIIFDFGTAITIDRVTSKGEYLGGNIAPGVRLRFESLHQNTGLLPMVEATAAGDNPDFGRSTAEAIRNGVMRGIEYEIKGYINQNPNAKVFFTGGDAKYFEKCQENPIFADYQLVIKGLERIIEHNAK